MLCPYCGRDSLMGPMPATKVRAEMVCQACGRTCGAYDWYGAGDTNVRRPAAA